MNIDAYSTCPCHPDKKIKFCCGKEIASDLNQIVSLSSAGQELAALDEIQRVIQKQGAKDCLLTIKTRLLISRDRIDDADQSNELLLQNSPNNVTGHFHRCLIRLHRGEISEAVNALQDAIDSNPSGEVPVALATGFRMVGIGLLQQGHLIGGRAHLKFASLLKDNSDRELLNMLFQTFQLENTPLFLQRNFEMPSISDQHANQEWAKKYHNAYLAAHRGQFRKAYRYLKKIDLDYPNTLTIKKGIAVLSLYLGCEIQEIASAWRDIADQDGLPIHQAIEAEGLYRLFNEDHIIDDYQFVSIECEIRDFQQVLEKCLSEDRLIAVDYDDEPPESDGDPQPPPRNRFVILEKPPVTAEEITVENSATICGNLDLYGKQTDREARIVIKTIATDDLRVTREFLLDRFSEFFLSEPVESESGKLYQVQPGLLCHWHIPKGISDKKYFQIFSARIKQTLLDQWCHRPSEALKGMTPIEAAQNPELRLTLEWALAEIENDPGLLHDFNQETIQAIREKLGLPQLPELTSDEVDFAALSGVQLSHLNFASFSDDDLMTVLEYVSHGQHPKALKKICLELLKRPSTAKLSHAEIYSLLASSCLIFEEGIDYFAKARAFCHEQDLPLGSFLMDELEFRFQRGRTEKMEELFNTIRLHHLNEPYVRQRLENFVSRIQGLAPSKSRTADSVAEQKVAAHSTPSKLELPGQSAVSQPQAGTSKIWIPE